MHHGIGTIIRENLVEAFTIKDIDFLKRWHLACDLCNAIQSHSGAVAEVVDYNHLITCLQQFDDGVGTYKTGTAGNKYL
jgi:hypothetical protein